MVHGMFETLVDFIEIEKAWMMVIFGQTENQKKFGYKWYELSWLTNWMFSRRHPEAGLAHLKWEMALTTDDAWYGHHQESIEGAKAEGTYGLPTHQALMAKEQYELYNWWVNIRPKRKDPYETADALSSGSIFSGFIDDDKEPPAREEITKAVDIVTEMEKAYDAEDEEMLIRLIRIRKSLWT
jgi:hypothetical protein